MTRRSLVGGTAAALGGAAMAGRPAFGQGTPASPASSGGVTMPPNYKGAQLADTAPVSAEPATLRIFVAGDATVDSYDIDNKFTSWYQERTNVTIEWQVASAVDSATVLSTTLASGDYPDVLMGFGLTPTQQLVYGSQGILIPIEEYIASDAPLAQQIFTDYPEAEGLITLPDGHIYSMPYVNDCYHCRSGNRMWVYQPWLETLGLEMPATPDDFRAMLEAFRDGDPNGTGSTVLPFGTDTGGVGAFLNWIYGAYFYIGVNNLRVQDGALVETLTDEGRREGLRFANSLYQAGLIPDETFTRDNDQLRQIANSAEPTIGAVASYYWGSFVDMLDSSPEARWRNYKPMPILEGPGGARFAAWNYYGAVSSGSFMVTDKCPDPALAIRWCDGFYELEATLRSVQGVLDEDVRWSAPGEMGINGEQALWTQLIQWSEIEGLNYWAQRNPNYRSNEFRLGEAVDPAAPTFELDLYEAVRDALFPYAQPQEQQPIPFALDQAQADEVTLLQTQIDAYVEEVRAQFIIGSVDLEAGWDVYVETLNQMGLPRLVEINNAAYQTALENVARIREPVA